MDEAILHFIHGFSSPLLDVVMVLLTRLASPPGVLLIAGCMGSVLLFNKRGRDVLVIALGVGGASLVSVILKLVFQRDRPELWEQLVVEHSFSFPSGHSVAASALAVSLMVVCWHTGWRWWAVAIGGVFMVVIGLTRLYLGVHYPSDVIAGWLVGSTWVLLTAGTIDHWRKAR